MKKWTLVLVLSLLLVLGAASVVQAIPPFPKNGAVVGILGDNACWWQAGSSTSFYRAEGRLQGVLTPNGTWKLTCIGEVVEADPPLTEALTISCSPGEEGCGLCTVSPPGYFLQTQEFRMVFTPSGESQFTCWGDAGP